MLLSHMLCVRWASFLIKGRLHTYSMTVEMFGRSSEVVYRQKNHRHWPSETSSEQLRKHDQTKTNQWFYCNGLASPSFMASRRASPAEIRVATSSNVRGSSTRQTAEVAVAARLDLKAIFGNKTLMSTGVDAHRTYRSLALFPRSSCSGASALLEGRCSRIHLVIGAQSCFDYSCARQKKT